MDTGVAKSNFMQHFGETLCLIKTFILDNSRAIRIQLAITVFAATSNSPSATGTAITEHSKHTAETWNGTIHAYQLEVMLSLLLVEARQSTLGFKSPGRHPSEE